MKLYINRPNTKKARRRRKREKRRNKSPLKHFSGLKNTYNIINQLANNKANRSPIANEILAFGWLVVLLFCVSLLVFRCAKGRRSTEENSCVGLWLHSQNWLQCWKATFCPFSIPTTILWYSLEFSTYYTF